MGLFNLGKKNKSEVEQKEKDKLIKEIDNRKGKIQVKEKSDKTVYAITLQQQSSKASLNVWRPTNDSEESYTLAEERRKKNNAFIISQGIVCFEKLPLVEASCDVKIKSIEEICVRAIASCLAIAVVTDMRNSPYEDSIKFFKPIIDSYGAYEFMNEKEKRVIDGTFSKQDLIDIDWEYEALWSLLYALSLVDDIRDGGKLCDCNYIISLFRDWPTVDELKEKCKLRGIEEILDMLDLYYRYHWACEDKRINPNTEIKNLNSSIVVERRRGLEWLISEENNWYNISLDT